MGIVGFILCKLRFKIQNHQVFSPMTIKTSMVMKMTTCRSASREGIATAGTTKRPDTRTWEQRALFPLLLRGEDQQWQPLARNALWWRTASRRSRSPYSHACTTVARPSRQKSGSCRPFCSPHRCRRRPESLPRSRLRPNHPAARPVSVERRGERRAHARAGARHAPPRIPKAAMRPSRWPQQRNDDGAQPPPAL